MTEQVGQGPVVAGLRWCVYTRVSSRSQVTGGDGLATQASQCEAWVAEQGGVVAGRASDEGVSGTPTALGQRTGWHTAVRMLREGQVDGIALARLDRLARDVVLQERLLAEVWELGGLVGCADPEQARLLDSGDPTRRLLRTMLGAVADFERAQIKARTKAGKMRARADGRWAEGHPPWGFRAKGGKLHPDPVQSLWLQQAAYLRDVVGMPIVAVAEFLAMSGSRLRPIRAMARIDRALSYGLDAAPDASGIPADALQVACDKANALMPWPGWVWRIDGTGTPICEEDERVVSHLRATLTLRERARVRDAIEYLWLAGVTSHMISPEGLVSLVAHCADHALVPMPVEQLPELAAALLAAGTNSRGRRRQFTPTGIVHPVASDTDVLAEARRGAIARDMLT